MLSIYDFLFLEVLGLTTFGVGFKVCWEKRVKSRQTDRGADKFILGLTSEALSG